MKHPAGLTGICPSCEEFSSFEFEGVQEVPEGLQEEMGKEIALYTCRRCGSTRTERNLRRAGCK